MMKRWTHLFVALALVLMMWAGGTARAAEGYDPIVVSAESTGHFSGDSDEVPSDQHQGTPHHHAACGEYQVAAWNDIPAASIEPLSSLPALARRKGDKPGREPDAQLRPPIA